MQNEENIGEPKLAIGNFMIMPMIAIGNYDMEGLRDLNSTEKKALNIRESRAAKEMSICLVWAIMER